MEKGSTPRGGRLRKLQSAHQLFNAYSGAAPINSQRQQQDSSRTPSSSFRPTMPPIPLQHSPQRRGRALSNSDVAGPKVSPQKSVSLQTKKDVASVVPKHAPKELDLLLRQGPKTDLALALQNLRHWILCDGMDADADGMSHSRIYVWLILLDAGPYSTDEYLALARRGPSPAHAKIANDTFRTFKTNPLFKRRVTDNSLIRLLNAAAWKLHDTSSRPTTNVTNLRGSPELVAGKSPGKREQSTYVQGMNVLCAPFLYVARSESEAFLAFYHLITRECPGYVRGAMDGVHRGVALVDRCLAIVDPKLSLYLTSKGIKAEVFAFASVLTMCASTPPLPEVLHLWDFLLAYGVHLNILCICAQLMIMREQLLAEASPGKLLRTFPPLDAKKVIMLTVGLVARVPDDLYEELVYHAQ